MLSKLRIVSECALLSMAACVLCENVFGQIHAVHNVPYLYANDTSTWNGKWHELIRGRDEALIFTASLFLVHETLFILHNVFLYLCHVNNWFSAYKIQPQTPPRELVIECVRHCFISQFITMPLALYYGYPLFKKYSNIQVFADLPDWYTIVTHCLASFIINETLFYFVHWTFHHPWIYKYIHKKHHRFTWSIGIASEFAHPIEEIFANIIPTLAGPMLLGSHLVTTCIWLAIRLNETIDTHSGYQFPFSPWIIVNGADRHNYHHSHSVGMYGGTMLIWDWIFGTDKPYNEFVRQRLKQS